MNNRALAEGRARFLQCSQHEARFAVPDAGDVYGAGHDGGFGGRWTFTRVFHSHGVVADTALTGVLTPGGCPAKAIRQQRG